MIAALALAALAFAAPAPSKPLWTVQFAGKRPRAAFFDATSSSLIVSLGDKNGEGGSLARVALTGKVENEKLARSKGTPGAIRGFGGKLYWISGNLVESKSDEGILTEGTIPKELGDATDVAVGRKGEIYVGTSSGNLVRISNGAVTSILKGLPISGLFILPDTLHILRRRRLQSISLSAAEPEPQAAQIAFCAKDCHGLERTSSGNWLTVSGARVLEVNGKGNARVLYSGEPKTELGRPAYVYHMETSEDFYVVPFPAEGVIRAFRVNALPK
ncbi:MAG: hypothetical protein ACXVB9_22035 [Bdellovibrionota bacterium]